MPNDEKGRGAHGIGERLNRHDARIASLNKEVNKLKNRVDTAASVGDIEMVGKVIRVCLSNNDQYIGEVVSVSKYKIRLKIRDTGSARETFPEDRTFNKGHIMWHEEY